MSVDNSLLERHLARPLTQALEDTPVVLVIGPRQAGKTTLCEQIATTRNARMLTFDDAGTLAAAEAGPATPVPIAIATAICCTSRFRISSSRRSA